MSETGLWPLWTCYCSNIGVLATEILWFNFNRQTGNSRQKHTLSSLPCYYFKQGWEARVSSESNPSKDYSRDKIGGINRILRMPISLVEKGA